MRNQKTLSSLTHSHFETNPINSICIQSSTMNTRTASEEYMTSTYYSNHNKILRQIQSLESNHTSKISDCQTPADTTVTVDMLTDNDDDISLISSDDDDDEFVLFTPAEKNDKGELKQIALELTKPFFLMPKTPSSRSTSESHNSHHLDVSLPMAEVRFSQE